MLRYYSGPNGGYGKVIEVFGWYGQQEWVKVICTGWSKSMEAWKVTPLYYSQATR